MSRSNTCMLDDLMAVISHVVSVASSAELNRNNTKYANGTIRKRSTESFSHCFNFCCRRKLNDSIYCTIYCHPTTAFNTSFGKNIRIQRTSIINCLRMHEAVSRLFVGGILFFRRFIVLIQHFD